MRYSALLAVPLLSVAAPASATLGMLCRPVEGSGPELSLVIAYGVRGVAGANLREGATRPWRSTMVEDPPLVLAQAWLDRELLMVDLADRLEQRRELRLRARFERPHGHTANGTMVHGGRTYRVRCVQN